MRILVTGATGFIGRPLVSELLQRGHEVRAMVRPAADLSSAAWAGDAETLVADLRVAQDLSGALRDVDAVIHLAAATQGSDDDKLLETMISTERLIDAMRRGDTQHLVLASSIVVYDWTTSEVVLSEWSPLDPRIWNRDGYTRAKYFQERYVRKVSTEAGWKLTVLRPGFVWGQGARYPLGPARQLGSSHLVFGTKTVLPLTHIVNCVRYVSAAVDGHGAAGSTINVIDDYDLTSADLVREYLARSGVSSRCITVPYPVAETAVRALGLGARLVLGKDVRLPDMFVPEIFAARYRPMRYDRTQLLRTLGSTPTLDLEECLEMTFGQKLNAPPQRSLSTAAA